MMMTSKAKIAPRKNCNLGWALRMARRKPPCARIDHKITKPAKTQ